MRTDDPATLRRQLVDAAFAAFTTQGYHATSVHAVRAATGVSGGALAHHFPTKRELALAVLNERVAPAVEGAWMAPVALAKAQQDAEPLRACARQLTQLDGLAWP